LVVYRDRSPEEIRDTYVAAWGENGWSEPALVAEDGWTMPGCPVNGPEAAADGDLVAMAWFTAARETPAVRLAFSQDGGRSFGEPVTIDEDGPFGRVDVALDDRGGAIVAWLARSGDRAAVRLRRVGASGEIADPVTIAETSGARASGFPRMVRHGDALTLAWVDLQEEQPSEIRVREILVASIPD
jgi:hypothetical protein